MVCLVGNTSFGAQLSIEIAGVTMQPSEFVKLSFVFFVASMLYQSTEWKQVVKVTVMAALHVLILVLSKDLGSALSVHAVCGHIELAVSDSRLPQRLPGWRGGLWTVPACPGPGDGMERSVVRY